MRSSTDFLMKVFESAHEKRNRIIAGLLVLSLLVFAGVFWQLRYTGITMTSAPICGIEEHPHTEECSEYVLIDSAVSLEEAAAQYTVYVLTDTGYTALTDVAAETLEPQYDAYYQLSYTCDIDEHIHSTNCYCDPTADVEDASVWENTLPDYVAGVWSEDLISIAISQLGYSESELNFQLSDSGERMGYTRYGQWYNNLYGKWDSMFVSFCLNYAGMTEDIIPYASGADSWTVKLAEAGLYHSGSSGLSAANIVFFDTDLDGDADCSGIVESINDDGTITVIEGDSFVGTEAADKVMRHTYLADDAVIFGYSVLPEQPEEEEVITYTAMLLSDDYAVSAAAVEGLVDFAPYISGVAFTSVKYDSANDEYSAVFNATYGDTTETVLKKSDVTAANNTFYYMIPSNINVTEALANGNYVGTVKNSSTVAFDFTIESDDGGETWYARIVFRDSYLDTILNDDAVLEGGFKFNTSFLGGEQNSNGDIVVDMEGSNDIVIDGDDIVYDDNPNDGSAVTKHYDVAIQKSGYYDSANSEIVYTIVVVSENGTPAENLIELTDTISSNGDYIVLPISDFTVGQRIYPNDTDGSSVELTYLTEGENGYSVTLPNDGSDLFTASLPQILDLTPDGAEDTANAYTTEYVITYSVSLKNADPNATYSPENKIVLNNTDNVYGENITVTDGEVVNVSQNMLNKSSSADYNSDVVTWTITVNAAGEQGGNIAGDLLTDDMFAQVVSYEAVTDEETGETTYNFTESSDITVSPVAAYHWELIDGKPAMVFDETQSGTGTNYNTYTIAYKTPLESSWSYSSEVPNTAYLDPDPENGTDTDRYRGDAKYYRETTNPSKTLVSAGEADTNGTKILNWQLNIPVPDTDITAGSHFEDILNNSYSSSDGLSAIDVSYITYSQITDIINNYQSLTVGDSGVGFTDFSLYFYGYDTSESAYYYYYYDKAAGQWYRSSTECYDHDAYNTNWDGTITYTYTATDTPTDVKFTRFRFVFDSDMDAATYGEGNITINYSSTFESASVVSELKLSNRVWNSAGNSADAEYTQRATVFKTDQKGVVTPTEYPSETGIITWMVKVLIPDDYTAGTPITITDTLPDGVTLSDIMVSFRNQWNDGDLNAAGVINGSSISFDCGHYDENNNWAWAADTTSVTGTISGNTVTIYVNDATNLNISGLNYFTIVYNCQINDFTNEIYGDGHEFGPYTNKVEATIGEGENVEDYGSSSQTQTIVKEVESSTVTTFPTDKRTNFDSSVNAITYYVDVNPAGADTVDGDRVTVTDTLTFYANFDKWLDIMKDNTVISGEGKQITGEQYLEFEYDKIMLYYPEKDENGEIIYYDDQACTIVSEDACGYLKADTQRPVPKNLWKWSYDIKSETQWDGNVLYTCVLTVELPDGMPAVLQYTYLLNSSTNSDSLGAMSAYNSFKDADGTSKQKNSEFYYELADGSGFVSSTVSYIIYKHEEGNMGIPLNGAIFTLYEYSGGTWVEKSTASGVVTYETGENSIYPGKAFIEFDADIFKYNTAYYVVETQAPESYELPDPAPMYYFYFPNEDSTEEASMPPNFLTDYNPFDFEGNSYTENISNERGETASITLTKSWKDGSGNDMAITSGSVTGTIYQVASTVRLAEGTGNAGGSGENIETAMVLNTFLRYQDVDVSDENGKVLYHEVGDPMLNDDGSQMTDEAGNLLYYTAREVIFDGDKSTWVTLEYAKTITVDEAATYEFNYTVPFSDILANLPDWWTQYKENPTTAGDAPNVYLQIDGLFAMLKAAGYDQNDVEIDVTTKMDGVEVPNSARVNVDNDEFQINVYNPWSELWTDSNALKTWSETFEVTLSVTIPDLSKDRTLSFALEDDANKAGQSDYNTGTANYEFATGAAVDVKMLLANGMSNWGINTALLEKNTGETTQSFTGTEATESLSDGKYYHIYNFNNILLDKDAAISGSLDNSEITDFVFVAVESADAYTDAELRTLAEQNYNKLVVYVVYDETPEEDGSITVPSYSNLDDTYVVYDQPYKTFTISADNNWKTTVSDLPLVGTYNGATVYYTYYVKEDPVSGYDDSYSNVTVYDGTTSKTITLKDTGDITITNTSSQTFELPETGSIGTVLLTVNALLFMVVPIMYIFRRRETVGGEE